MKSDEMNRLYANAAKNLSRGWLEVGSTVFAATRRLVEVYARVGRRDVGG